MALTRVGNDMLEEPSVSVEPQTWSDAEKKQARSNVGITGASFSASKASDQTAIVTGVATKVTYSTEEFDEGALFTSSSWTPPAGKAVISASARVTAGIVDGQSYTLTLYKNGAEYKYLDNTRASGASAFTLSGAVVVSCDGDDIFEVYFTGNGTGDKTIAGSSVQTYFQGYSLP